MDPKVQELLDKIDGRMADMAELQTKLGQADGAEDRKALNDQVEGLQKTVEALQAERDARIQESEKAAMQTRMDTLSKQLEELRKPDTRLTGIPGDEKAAEGSIYGPGSAHSFYFDVKSADKGDQAARQRIMDSYGDALIEGKAMTEGTGSAGGFLVTPQYLGGIAELRLAEARLRNILPSLSVTTDEVILTQQTGGLTAGWVAELAAKPGQDMTFAQVTTNVFTAAGLATVSNQLLRDSRPAVDGLINSELAKRLNIVEELAIISGSGTGQPRGILNTSGINSVVLSVTTIPELLDAIVDAMAAVETNYLGSASHIVMHPRTWARLLKARDANTYIYSVGGTRPNEGQPGQSLFGIPVVLTPNIPTNLGAGTNESRVIVGNFSEGLILDREGIVIEDSSHVYFTTNQTVFRGEMRMGFTAGRYPAAFSVISGTGLAAG